MGARTRIARRGVRFTCVVMIAACAGAVGAQDYPIKPIRLVVPFPPGAGNNDILGRALAQRLTDLFGQNVIVDNRPGAGGMIGSDMVAKAAHDGYTLLLGTNGPIAVSQHVVKKMPYDPFKDLVPVTMISVVPYALVLNPAVPAKDIKELIALAKSRPGQMHYASAGITSTPHLCGELFNTMAAVNMVHVPYKGAAPATIDTVGGQVQMFCAALGPLLPQIKAGRLRAIAVTTLQRSPIMPELPTASEQGLAGFDVNSWNGIMAPAKLPRALIDRLHQAIAKVTESQEWKSYLLAQGIAPVLMDSKQFSDYIRNESVKWGRVVKAAGITAE